MKTILIADDEYLVRIGIRSITNWEEHGYCVVGEAQNGKEALEMIEQFRPDIVLTDLKMEPIDGLEVMRQAAQRFQEVQFVVLSSYNDFDNVRTAMKLGAVDYLFKLSITEEEILRVLDEVPVRETKPAGELSVENRELMKTQLFHKLVHRDYLSGEQLGKDLRQLDAGLVWDSCYCCVLLDVDNFFLLKQAEDAGGTSLFKFALQNIVQEVAAEQLGASTVNYDNAQLLLLIPQEYTALTEEKLRQCAALLQEYTGRYLGVEISCVVSDTFFGMEEMGGIYTQLIKKMSLRFWKQAGDSPLIGETSESGVQNALPEQAELRGYLRGKDITRAEEWLSCYFHTLRSFRPNIREAHGRLLELYAALCCCKEWGYDADKAVDSYGLSLSRALTEYERLTDMEQAVKEFLEGVKQCLLQKGNAVRTEILDVQQFVREHLSEELTVQQLSQRIHMNESYFSHLFKRETGQNFADFVLAQRMERAQALLRDTNLRVGEISLKVGIENSNYFSVVFKRACGKTPQEFRRSIQGNER